MRSVTEEQPGQAGAGTEPAGLRMFGAAAALLQRQTPSNALFPWLRDGFL